MAIASYPNVVFATEPRLVRKICPHCAQPHNPTPDELSLLGLNAKTINLQHYRKGQGCSLCFESGYLAIIELLNVDDVVRQIIYEGTTTQLRRYLYETRFHSFRIAAVEKGIHSITTVLPNSTFAQKPVEPSILQELNSAIAPFPAHPPSHQPAPRISTPLHHP